MQCHLQQGRPPPPKIPSPKKVSLKVPFQLILLNIEFFFLSSLFLSFAFCKWEGVWHSTTNVSDQFIIHLNPCYVTFLQHKCFPIAPIKQKKKVNCNNFFHISFSLIFVCLWWTLLFLNDPCLDNYDVIIKQANKNVTISFLRAKKETPPWLCLVLLLSGKEHTNIWWKYVWDILRKNYTFFCLLVENYFGHPWSVFIYVVLLATVKFRWKFFYFLFDVTEKVNVI